MKSRYQIRKGTPLDAELLVGLMHQYCAEIYPVSVYPSVEKLQNDLKNNQGKLFFLIAEDQRQKAVGFISWEHCYDWHCTSWGSVLSDFYVEKTHRGSGLALQMIVRAFAKAQSCGAEFMITLATAHGFGQKLCARFAHHDKGEQYTFGDDVFRAIATSPSEPGKAVVKHLKILQQDKKD